MFVRTERLFLRPGWPEDFDELKAALGDRPVARAFIMSPLPDTPAELRDLLARPDDGRLPHSLIYLRAPGEPRLVGAIALDETDGHVELRFWIAREFHGQGYGAEALRAMVAQARTLGHSEIVATDLLDSEDSARVLTKAGFRQAGETQCRYRGREIAAKLYVAQLQAVA